MKPVGLRSAGFALFGMVLLFQVSVLSWLMFPVYVWQGIAVRVRIERLQPSALPVSGVVAGEGDALRLLVIGDSTVASVGMERIEDTFTFCIAQALNKRSGRPVHWRAAGANSASSGDLRDHVVPHIAGLEPTHILLSVGTNDMKNFHLISRFKREFGGLLYAVKTRFPDAQVIWTQIPDMRRFPALPEGLGRVLAARAALINIKGAQLCGERGAIAAGAFPIVDGGGFARDGFHPNGEGYRAWASHLVPYFSTGDA